MFFCENCNLLLNDNICGNCNKKQLRSVEENDFCYFIDLDVFNAKIFEEMLKNNKIDFVFLPIRNNVGSTAFSKEADTHRIYLKFKQYELGKDSYKEFFL